MKSVKCRVHPHDPKNAVGSHDVKIGVSRLPDQLRDWDGKKFPPRICLEQTEEDTNFTMLHVLFTRPEVHPPESMKELKFHNANLWRIDKVLCDPEVDKEVAAAWKNMQPSHISINIKGRYIKQLKHPIPVGAWEGTVREGDGWAVFHLQACTLRLKGIETKRTILMPGDPDFEQVIRN